MLMELTKETFGPPEFLKMAPRRVASHEGVSLFPREFPKVTLIGGIGSI